MMHRILIMLLAAVTLAALLAAGTPRAAAQPEPRVLAQIDDAGVWWSALNSRYGLSRSDARAVANTNWTSYSINPKLSAQTVAAALAREPGVRAAEADAVIQLPPAPQTMRLRGYALLGLRGAPNDPLYPQQWHHAVTHSERAWARTVGDGIVIAVIDSGVDCTHPDLRENCQGQLDLVDNDTTAQDDYGHGTAVAGTAAAGYNNATGGAGMAGAAWIRPVRAFNAQGQARTSDLVAAVQATYLDPDGVDDIAVMSWGAPTASAALAEAIRNAEARGVAMFAASGNDGAGSAAWFPASYSGASTPYVLAVGSTTTGNARAGFSNQVGVSGVVAPGEAIVTTQKGGQYTAFTGTSASAPLAAGVAALLKRQKMSRTPQDLYRVLRVSAQRIDAGPLGVGTGWGMIDAGAALDLEATGPAVPTPTAQPTTPAPTVTSAPSAMPPAPTWTATAGVPTAGIPTAGPTVAATATEQSTARPTEARTATPQPTMGDIDARIATAVRGTVVAVQTRIAVKAARQTLWLPIMLFNVCPAGAPCPTWGQRGMMMRGGAR